MPRKTHADVVDAADPEGASMRPRPDAAENAGGFGRRDAGIELQ